MCKTDWRPIDGETHNINGQSIPQIYSLSLASRSFLYFSGIFHRFHFEEFFHCLGDFSMPSFATVAHAPKQRGKWNRIDRSPIINWSRVPQEGSVFYLAAREKSLDGKCFSLSERESFTGLFASVM
jgi:hypothetical protein